MIDVERLKQLLEVAQRKANFFNVTFVSGEGTTIAADSIKFYDGFIMVDVVVELEKYWDRDNGVSSERPKATRKAIIFLDHIVAISLETKYN